MAWWEIVLGVAGIAAIPLAFGAILNEPLTRIVDDIAKSQGKK